MIPAAVTCTAEPGRGGEGGFTLFELLISLTIVAVLLVLTFGALRLGSRAWERGERDLYLDQQARVGLTMLRRQIASFREVAKESQINTKTDSADTPVLYFEGTDTAMRFFTSLALIPDRNFGPLYVRYVVTPEEDETEGLYLFEKSSALLLPEDKETVLDDVEGLIPLLIGMKSIRFSYLKTTPDDPTQASTFIPEWQDQWNPEDDIGIPGAVRVTLEDGRGDEPVTVTARIRVEHES